MCHVKTESTQASYRFAGLRSIPLLPRTSHRIPLIRQLIEAEAAAAEIEHVLGRPPRAPDADAPRASGTLAAHYAPRTPARILSASALASASMESAGSVAVLARTFTRPAQFAGAWIDAPRDATPYAHDLYANLRALDATDAVAILIEAVPDDTEWHAVRDRLMRATSGVDDDRD